MLTTLFSPDGVPFRTSSPSIVTRLKTRGYSEQPPEGDELFHPADHKVEQVQEYIEANPADAQRVIAEEMAGKARVSIVGDEGYPAVS